MPGAADDLLDRARAARRERRLDEAVLRYEQAIAILRGAADPFRLAHAIRHLGDVHVEAGRAASAEPHYREALSLYRSHPDAPTLDRANAIRSVALFEEQRGRVEEASDLWREAYGLYAELDVQSGVKESAARIERLRKARE
jgi:tetratricopeptide (TPR) repeat protein